MLNNKTLPEALSMSFATYITPFAAEDRSEERVEARRGG